MFVGYGWEVLDGDRGPTPVAPVGREQLAGGRRLQGQHDRYHADTVLHVGAVDQRVALFGEKLDRTTERMVRADAAWGGQQCRLDNATGID